MSHSPQSVFFLRIQNHVFVIVKCVNESVLIVEFTPVKCNPIKSRLGFESPLKCLYLERTTAVEYLVSSSASMSNATVGCMGECLKYFVYECKTYAGPADSYPKFVYTSFTLYAMYPLCLWKLCIFIFQHFKQQKRN